MTIIAQAQAVCPDAIGKILMFYIKSSCARLYCTPCLYKHQTAGGIFMSEDTKNRQDTKKPGAIDAKQRWRDYYREYMRKYRAANPDKIKAIRDRYIIRRAEKLKAAMEAEAAGQVSTRSAAHGQQQAAQGGDVERISAEGRPGQMATTSSSQDAKREGGT